LHVTFDLPVIHRLFVDSKPSFLIFETAFDLDSSEFHHGVPLKVLDVEAQFGESALELLLTAMKVRYEDQNGKDF
jgi:hypothetical protein